MGKPEVFFCVVDLFGEDQEVGGGGDSLDFDDDCPFEKLFGLSFQYDQ